MADRASPLARGTTAALILLCVLAAMAFFVPVPREMNCLHVSMDIAAGRVRYERYLLLVKVSDTVDESGLYALYCELFPDRPQPVWRLVKTQSRGFAGVHALRLYRGSVMAANSLIGCFRETPFSEDAKREVVRTFLSLLHAEQSSYRAKEYAWDVCALAGQRTVSGGEVQVSDLPPPPE